jgi:hypothetical protein
MKRSPLLFVGAYLALAPLLARAAGPGEVTDENLKLKDTLAGGPNDVLVIVNRIIDYLFTALLVAAVIFVLYAAFKYLTSSGNEEGLQTAHKMLIWAMVAIAVALVAGGIGAFVESVVLDNGASQTIQPENGSLDTYDFVGGGAA